MGELGGEAMLRLFVGMHVCCLCCGLDGYGFWALSMLRLMTARLGTELKDERLIPCC